MSVLRSAVTHPKWVSFLRSSTRALGIMPRSPDHGQARDPERAWISGAIGMDTVGSAVFPGDTRAAMGNPARVASMPYSLSAHPRFLFMEYPNFANGY